MLLKYEFENFNSFKEKVSFSMLAPSTKVKNRFRDNYVKLTNGFDVQKTAVIVGENAGGKSNFVHSFSLLKYFFTNNDSVNSRKYLINSNYCHTDCPQRADTIQSFFVEISDQDDVIYSYELKYDFLGIINEKLSLKKKKSEKSKVVFDVNRNDKDIKCDRNNCESEKCHIDKVHMGYKLGLNSDYIKGFDKRLFENSSPDQRMGLFVTKFSILDCVPAVKFVKLIKDSLLPESNYITFDLYKAIKKEQEDLDVLRDDRYFKIFRLVDYSIFKVDIDEDDPFKKSIVYRKGRDGRVFTRELGKDSSGVREFFAWAVQIFKVIYENKIVIADEMDRVLNPVLADRIVSLINGTDHKGQFIFTTHNVLHLDLKNYMKEQIYFITKDVETLESEMYSLSEFPEVRYETSKVYEFYMKGILGGTASE
ncbi:ATPase/GTPase, AAA15 family [Lachnospiraceae bacterium]|nr:ATPase/GTPase, AAA15 family [Lachnospiraceae bacterium]